MCKSRIHRKPGHPPHTKRKMKTINVSFDDDEIEAIEKVKGELSWHELILSTTKPRVLGLYDDRDVNIFSIAFDVANNFVHNFDMPVQMGLKTIVMKLAEEKE